MQKKQKDKEQWLIMKADDVKQTPEEILPALNLNL
jgi:hypothetical protein